MHDRPEDRAARNSGLATAMAPLIVREDPALQNCLARLDALAGGCEAEPVQAAEGIEIRGREGSVGHVEVFQMASVRTSIIGRPRRLSPHRRAHPATDRYTLICEEPVWLFADEGVAVGRRSGRWGPPVLLVARSLGARLVFRGASEATLLMSPLQVNDELRDVEAEVMSRSSKRLR